MANAIAEVQCLFHVRTPSKKKPGKYVYTGTRIGKGSPYTQGNLYTVHPPVPGDFLWVMDPGSDKLIYARVVSRSWHHAQFGSRNWPYTEALPKVPELLDIVVEEIAPGDGVFGNEE